MAITSENIKDCLGSKFDPTADYVVVPSASAASRLAAGHCRLVGSVETENDGTMAVLERNPKPKPSIIEKVKGSLR